MLLELRYFEEMSTAEMALVFDVPRGTIKSRLSTARMKLEVMLAEPCRSPSRRDPRASLFALPNATGPDF